MPLCLSCRVSAVGDGWIELERPLQYDIQIAWQVWVYRFETPLQHSGYEDFTILFKHGACVSRGACALPSCQTGAASSGCCRHRRQLELHYADLLLGCLPPSCHLRLQTCTPST